MVHIQSLKASAKHNGRMCSFFRTFTLLYCRGSLQAGDKWKQLWLGSVKHFCECQVTASCAGCLGAGEGRADGGLNTFIKSALENNRNTGLSRSWGRQNLRMFSKNPAHSRVTKVLSTPNLIWLSFQPFGTFWTEPVVPVFTDEGMEGPLGGEPGLAMVSRRMKTPLPHPGCLS